jgi:hypothetical protein
MKIFLFQELWQQILSYHHRNPPKNYQIHHLVILDSHSEKHTLHLDNQCLT